MCADRRTATCVRDFLQREVEDLAGRRVAERRNEHDVAVVEALSHRLDVDAPDFAGPLHVDAVEHADRLGGDEVAADDADARAGHRRVGDAERQQRLDAAARMAGAFEHAVERLGVGDAQAAVVAAGDVLLLEYRLDLRTRAMHDDQPDAEAVQQVEVVDDAEKRVVGDDFAAEGDDERLAAQRVNVRRGRTDPLHECARRRRVRRGIDARDVGHGRAPGRRAATIIASGASHAASPIIAPRRARCRASPARSARSSPATGFHVLAATRKSQPGTARRGHAAARVGADPRRRRQRQDARAHDAHRVAARDRAGDAAVGAGGDLHQQGGQGNADAACRR